MILSFVDALNFPEGATRITVPAVRYAFEFEVQTPIRSPEFAGSMIRGAFGRALRKISCMTRQSDCKACPLYRTCPYTGIFETPPPLDGGIQKFSQIPNPYVIEPPEWGRRIYEVGNRFSFSLILWGKSREQLALVIYAMKCAFSNDVGHGKATLCSVYICENEKRNLIYSPEMERVAAHSQETVLEVPSEGVIGMNLETPMRLQNNGHPLGANLITPRVLLMTLVRRISLLSEYHCDRKISLNFSQLIIESEEVRLYKQLSWRDWTRYSNRQKHVMSLGGVMGEIYFENLSPVWRIFLTLGTMSHLGKNASFGLGKYCLR